MIAPHPTLLILLGEFIDPCPGLLKSFEFVVLEAQSVYNGSGGSMCLKISRSDGKYPMVLGFLPHLTSSTPFHKIQVNGGYVFGNACLVVGARSGSLRQLESGLRSGAVPTRTTRLQRTC